MKSRAPRFTRCFAVVSFAGALAFVAPARAQILTKAIEVRSLTPAQAQEGLEAHLHGIVVFVDTSETSAVFIQDETSTTFFRPQPDDAPASNARLERPGRLRAGDEIEVRGKTRMGRFLPGLDVSKARVISHGERPPGVAANYDDLVSARYHYQRVAVEGVIRSVAALDEGRSLVRLAMGSRLIDVRVDVPPDRDRSLVDSRVRIQGLAAGYHNQRRQLVQAHVRMIDWTDVTMLDPAPPTARVPLISAQELLSFQVNGHGDRRVRIAGMVTAAFPGDRVFLRQEETAFGVRMNGSAVLNVGDQIEIAGFPEMDHFSASMVDGELVSREAGPPPAPVEIGALEGIAGLHDGQLVSVTATLANAFKTDSGTTLVLQGKARTIQARLPESVTPPQTGSRVRITAICLVETAQPGSGFASEAGVVGLRTRNAADVVVLESPPWWTVRRLGLILAALGAVTLLAGLWIVGLRIQVRRQTTALRRRIESEVVLEERQRIAREFHDSLEQELAGVTLRLDALATRELDDKGRTLTATTRNLVSRIQSETRNLISDLRDSSETAGDLAAALVSVATRNSADSGIAVEVKIIQPIPPLPAGTVHDLRQIARESVTNALKHASATSIRILLGTKASRLVMRIADDGRGFDPAAKSANMRGHFGCAGIRERSRKLGADVVWHSSAGHGTTVEVSLSLRGQERNIAQGAVERLSLDDSRGYEENTTII